MSLMGNGKSDVRNHFSTHRKAYLHLDSAESRPPMLASKPNSR